jgi:hypothetical protein
MFPHDLKLYEYKKAFVGQVRHPENTEFVGNYNFLGALDSQRVMYKETFPQGCDYIVGEVRKYIGTEESIKTFYAKQRVKTTQKEKGIRVIFIPMATNGRIDISRRGYGPNEIRILQMLGLSPFIQLDSQEEYYFVAISELEISNLDIRCLF